MRIKKLEINGFKSFADRGVIAFGEGITGVVGPNGCGKSNVVDAIRWCMGEMSAKHLRGRAMQDVIFAGSDSRGPLGMAEVTLTFHNDGDVPPQYAPFSEIAVTRRLHRDGTSEYLINKVQARLRDITDLFLGTGAGTRAYSIIEQGRIGFVVSARPEDRRSLIEEVAGITKFKVRKKAAERRLDATEQNLLRVNDIVTELERQLGSLRRQARKAERYRELRADLRDLELHAASLEYLRLAAVEKVQQGERDTLEQHISDAQSGLGAAEAGLEVDRQRLLDEEQKLQNEQKASAESDAKLAALERDVAHWREQLEDAVARMSSARLEVSDAKQRIAGTDGERQTLATVLADHEAGRDADRTHIEGLAAAVGELQAQLVAIDRDIEQQRKDALEHVHGAAQQRALVGNLQKQRIDIRNRLESAVVEQDALGQKRGESQRHEAELSHQAGELATDLAAWRDRLSAVRLEVAEVGAEASESAKQLAGARDELHKRRSRLHSLEEIARRFEGYSDGVRTLLGARSAAGEAPEGSKPVVPGFRALVSDVLSTTPVYERAIEAALGHRVQYLVVDSHTDAATAIAYLKEHKGGLGGFLPAAPRLTQPWTAVAVPAGVLGTARALVESKPGFADVAEYLLADVLVVDTLDTALSLFAAGATDARLAGKVFVTLEGEVVDKGGAVAGGSHEGAGLLAKRREIRELGAEVERLETAFTAKKAATECLEARRLQLEVDAQQLDKDIRAAELEKLELDKDLEAAHKELQRFAERLEVLGYEVTQRRDELAVIDDDERAASGLAEKAEAGRKDVEERLAALGERRREHALGLEDRTAALTTAKVQLAARDEKVHGARAALERLAEVNAELAARIGRDEGIIAEGERTSEELRTRILEGSEALAETLRVAQARRSSLLAARGRYETDRGGMGGIEQRLREERKGLEAKQQALLQVRMELQRTDLERVRLIEQTAERHDVALLAVVCDYHLRPAPGAGDLERRAELERAIKAIGPINLTAIDECADVEKRYEFLKQQRDDLQNALDALRRAILRINRASRERFRQAFDAVNEMFQQIFPRLFRGGEARLELVESDDLLESGVEIVAMPPGKKLQNVTLLSGGEKALTATALVFSIFLIKPSPFCVLDEVDAPLDEANVGRFNEMLREISKLSQFIVITHNKLTMSEADRLYGITMEEPGLSKVVSVDLSQRGEEQAA